jgi:pilus assembly protein CpaE
VLNRADMKVGLTPHEVEKTLDMPITASIPQSNDVPTSINHGKPIALESPRHPVSQAIKRLALDCISDAPPLDGAGGSDAAGDAKRGGLLRRRTAR